MLAASHASNMLDKWHTKLVGGWDRDRMECSGVNRGAHDPFICQKIDLIFP